MGWPLVCVHGGKLLAQARCGRGLLCLLFEAVSTEGHGCDGLWVAFEPQSAPRAHLHGLPRPSLCRAAS